MRRAADVSAMAGARRPAIFPGRFLPGKPLAAAGLAAAAFLCAQGAQAATCSAEAMPVVEAVRITAAAPSGGPGSPCRVQGVIEKEVGFELWLPEAPAWNGRFLAAGVGGQAGQVNGVELKRTSARGYAAASTDAGHKAADKHWLLNNPERAANYAERANHLLAVKAKALTAAYYGRASSQAFFLGCSGGGRQALTELQRFPDDYDGIIAGAPGVNTPEMSARRMWEMIQHSRYQGVMSEADWGMVARAAVDQCDALDGLKDGIVTNPTRCHFKAQSIACRPGQAAASCLNPAQVALVSRIYAPLKDENGKLIDTGILPGVKVQPALAPEPFTPGPAYLATVLFGDGVHADAAWDSKTFRIDKDLPAVDRLMDLHADDPKVEAFVRHGGKLILYQGWADPLVSAEPTVAYYQAIQARFGKARAAQFVRLFMVPGMEHCRGGGVPDAFGAVGSDAPILDADHDMLSALERWTTGGPAPERIVASRVDAGKVTQTRPLCAHPLEAKYRGHGDPNDAGSFACAAPTKE